MQIKKLRESLLQLKIQRNEINIKGVLMSIGVIFALVLVGIVFISLFYLVSIYNSLVRFKNEYKNSFSQIDVQLQRRYDLIPNLVNVAKEYMAHEKETLEAVINARNQALKTETSLKKNPESSKAVKKFNAAEANLNKNMGSFLALFENYPDLKANTTMNDLMEELSSTENKVSFARQHYNDSVMQYNIGIQEFPNNFLAVFFNFANVDQLDLEDEEARKAIKVEF
jgi:LemA protein